MLGKQGLKNAAGFSLIELMTALAINVILFVGLIAVFLSNIDHYRQTININRLNQQMQTSMMIMVDEIRRAGYWANAQSDIGSATNNNPFMTSSMDIATGNSGTCILFGYDADSDGAIPSIGSKQDDERYGFRLNNGNLQTRPFTAPYNCNTSNTWENVTDPNIVEITALTFTINTSTIAVGPGNKSLIQRSVDITMTGRLVSDNSVTKTLTKHVRIMNDKFTDE